MIFSPAPHVYKFRETSAIPSPAFPQSRHQRGPNETTIELWRFHPPPATSSQYLSIVSCSNVSDKFEYGPRTVCGIVLLTTIFFCFTNNKTRHKTTKTDGGVRVVSSWCSVSATVAPLSRVSSARRIPPGRLPKCGRNRSRICVSCGVRAYTRWIGFLGVVIL